MSPGFLESIYEQALCVELSCRQVPFRRQVPVQVEYKGKLVGQGQLDLLVGGRLVVEIKAVEARAAIHCATACRSALTSRRLGAVLASLSTSTCRCYVQAFAASS